MRIRVRLFAQLRLAAGRDAFELSVSEGATVGDALREIYAAEPGLRGPAERCMTAVGLEYAGVDRVLLDGEEVSLIPPVQGG